MDDNLKKKKSVSKWLDKLQQESWQLELLISGFAIFGLLQFLKFLEVSLLEIDAFVQMSKLYFLFITSLIVAINIFLINLIIHVFVRGLWIGAIGLRYVSGDINYENLNYSNRFKLFLQNKIGSFDKYIITLERISSIMFAYSFLLVFAFSSIFITLFSTIFILNGIAWLKNLTGLIIFNWISIIFGFFVVLSVIFSVIDFVFLGVLKKIKQQHFSRIYLFLYKFIGILSFSFVWRPLLINFLNTPYTRKLIILIIPYFIINITLNAAFVSNFSLYPQAMSGLSEIAISQNHYDDQRKSLLDGGRKIENISIPSFQVNGATFEYFVRYNTETEAYIKAIDSTMLNLQEKGKLDLALDISIKFDDDDSVDTTVVHLPEDERNRINIDKIKDNISKSYVILMDNDTINRDSIKSFFYEHPFASEEGMRCFFPIQLSSGIHILKYQKFILDSDNVIDTIEYSVPFLYE